MTDIFIYLGMCLIFENSKDFFNAVGKKAEEPDKALAASQGIVVRGKEEVHSHGEERGILLYMFTHTLSLSLSLICMYCIYVIRMYVYV
jgi:hypothetical protein